MNKRYFCSPLLPLLWLSVTLELPSTALAAERYALNLTSAQRPWTAATLPEVGDTEDLRLYVTRTPLAGLDFYRLRLGFFSSRRAAERSRNRFTQRFPRAWVTTVSNAEWSQYGKSAAARSSLPTGATNGATNGATKIAMTGPTAPVTARPASAVAQAAPARSERKSSASAFRHSFDSRIEGGYDSNPLKLGSALSRGGGFGRLSINYAPYYRISSNNRIFVDGRISVYRFQDSVNAANSASGRVSLGWQTRNIPGFSRVRLGARYRVRRSTFVDQATGVEAIFSGQSIGSRFDYGSSEAFLDLDAKISSSTRLALDSTFVYRDYRDDFAALGLDRLDYTQITVEPALNHQFSDSLRAKLEMLLRGRFYKDRRAEDLNGANIAGSDLRYYYVGARASLTKRLGDRTRLTLGTDVERRIDDESGFDDRTQFEVFGRSRFTFSGGDSLSFDASWMYRWYDDADIAAVDEENDGGRRKNGFRLRGNYSHPVHVAGIELPLFVRGRFDSFNNSNSIFQYRRWAVSAGLRKKF